MDSLIKTKKESAKTVLDLSPFERKQYHPFGRAGEQSFLPLKNYQRSARAVAKSIARELVKRFGAHKVLLFGSVARGDIHKKSDIDLAAWGIPPKKFYRAVAFVTGYSKEWKIDLIDANDCRKSLGESILKDGIEL